MVWHIQTPGATLPRQNRTAPRLSSTAKTALTYSAVILCSRSERTGPGPPIFPRRGNVGVGGVVPCPGADVRHRKPAGLRNPPPGRAGGWHSPRVCRTVCRGAWPGVEVRRPFRLGDGVPARQIPRKARYLAPNRGGGRRAEPGLRTSRQKELAAAAAKKPPPPGPPRYPKGFFRRTPFCLSPKKKPLGLLNAPQKKNPWPVYAPQGCRPQKNRPRRGRPGKQRRFVKEAHFLLGRNRDEICRTSAGQGRLKGQKAPSERPRKAQETTAAEKVTGCSEGQRKRRG